MLEGLSGTVCTSIPSIRADIETFILDSSKHEFLENAYETMHPVADVAEMLKISVLHQIMLLAIEMVEDIASDVKSGNNIQAEKILDVIDQVQPYLTYIQTGSGSIQNIVTNVVIAYHRFKNISQEND